jgi:xanthine dehydrogenase accessory factor
MGTGVAVRLWRSGFDVVALETPCPLAVRRTVSFSEAVFEGQAHVEEVIAVRARSAQEAMQILDDGAVPVLVDREGASIGTLRPGAVVDAILAKRNTGTTKEMAPLVIGLGPGFAAGEDVHAVIETNRGPDLGRIFWRGRAEANTGRPSPILGHSEARVLRAPVGGEVRESKRIGEIVDEGEAVAEVGGVPVRAVFRGVLRGLLRSGTSVNAGLKIGDVDPRLDPTLCYRVSDKSLAIAGGVLEALMAYRSGRLV